MLLATAAVHHHLIREELRTQCGIICETGEARDVAQFALLVGYGAGAINPYLAFETIGQLVAEETFIPDDMDRDAGIQNYLKACDKGLLKTMAKMGISTLQSYKGAQIFEAVGLGGNFTSECRKRRVIDRSERCCRCARHLDQFDARQVLLQPTSTLGERLRMRADALDAIERPRVRQ